MFIQLKGRKKEVRGEDVLGTGKPRFVSWHCLSNSNSNSNSGYVCLRVSNGFYINIKP